MRESKILYFALGVLLVVSVGAVGLHDSGIEFPDGSFQKTAAGFTATTAVQGQVGLGVVGTGECTGWTTLFAVPAGKRLVIEWLAAETAIFGGAATPGTHPVDVSVRTHNGVAPIIYPFARLAFPASIGSSFFFGSFFHANVRLYSEGNHDVEVLMCLNQDVTDEGVGKVSFTGYLVDVP
jgi:hypothetical protein